jgi:hypothetical protein
MLRRTWLIFASLILLASAVMARNKPVDEPSSKMVDGGTFDIFQNGRQVATEDFTIRQLSGSSVTTTHLHLTSAKSGILEQTAELTLLPDGSLSHYEWTEESPAHSSATVVPGDQVLVMHTETGGKTKTQYFFLRPSSFILDDYVFATREVLLWRYLASSCKPLASGEGCELIRSRFPVLIPRRNTSGQVFIEFKGYDDMPLNGRPHHLRHFLMQTGGPSWNLWLDEHYKLLRISIPDAGIEVLRQETPTSAPK